MLARVHMLETTPEQHDEGLEIVRDEVLPWLRDATGFRGLIRLANRSAGKTFVVTLWANEEALRASAEAAEHLSGLISATTGANRLALEDYEVEFFDVDA